jgi:DNA polymerase IV
MPRIMEPPLPPPDELVRKIIHIDMDAFYASVEQRDNPDWRGKPIAVGGSGVRGVVSTASYEARAFGVRSAMPGARARKLCPDLIFAPLRFEAYRAVSAQIRVIFERFTDRIQPLSLDEAYLDVTHNKLGIVSATYIAEEIRRMIREELGLTASAGVSYNKLIAKLASDQNKPDGLCVITPERGAAFVQSMPVERLHGIGPVTARRMHEMGLKTGADLARCSVDVLQAHFGKAALYYYWAVRGQDNRPVEERQERKSISVEDTFETDLRDGDALAAALNDVGRRLWLRVDKAQAYGRTVTLKIKFSDFTIITRSHSFDGPVSTLAATMEVAHALLMAQLPVAKGVRLIGLGLHNFGGSAADAQGTAASSLQPRKTKRGERGSANQLMLAL